MFGPIFGRPEQNGTSGTGRGGPRGPHPLRRLGRGRSAAGTVPFPIHHRPDGRYRHEDVQQKPCGQPSRQDPCGAGRSAPCGRRPGRPAAGPAAQHPCGAERGAGRSRPGTLRRQPDRTHQAQAGSPAAAGSLCRSLLAGFAAVGGGVGGYRHPAGGTRGEKLYDGGYHRGDGGGVGRTALRAGDSQRQRGRQAHRHDPHDRLRGARGREAGTPDGRTGRGGHRPSGGGGYDPGGSAHPERQGPVHQPVGSDRGERAGGEVRRRSGRRQRSAYRAALPGLSGQQCDQRQRPGRGGRGGRRYHAGRHGRNAGEKAPPKLPSKRGWGRYPGC